MNAARRPGVESGTARELCDGSKPMVPTATDSTAQARCRRCHRPLLSPAAVDRGLGWRCAAREAAVA